MDILETIVREKHREVAALPPGPITPEGLRAARAERGPERDFLAALRRPRRGPLALIAEVKKASPSAGVIRPDFDPVRIARAYEQSGATCLSVLTDEKFFQGALASLRAIRAAVQLPLLRKDFIIDERQILESIAWGADAILLIVAILDDVRLRLFHRLALEAGLTVLVEVHDEVELDRAWDAGARLIGVNNRNLRTFSVDLATTERLAARLFRMHPDLQPPPATPPSPSRTAVPEASRLLVAESGIRTHDDVLRLARCGAGAVLVGESLMRHADFEAKVAELLSGTSGSQASSPLPS